MTNNAAEAENFTQEAFLQVFRKLEQVHRDTLVLPNCDLDSGKPTRAAEYSLTDDTYAKLLAQLSDKKFASTPLELRANIIEFYGDLSAPIETKKDQVRWRSVLTSLDQLRLAALAPVVAGNPAY